MFSLTPLILLGLFFAASRRRLKVLLLIGAHRSLQFFLKKVSAYYQTIPYSILYRARLNPHIDSIYYTVLFYSPCFNDLVLSNTLRPNARQERHKTGGRGGGCNWGDLAWDGVGR